MSKLIRFPVRTQEGRIPLDSEIVPQIERIERSLERINVLMRELKLLADKENKDDNVASSKR